MDPQNPDPAQVTRIMATVLPVIGLFVLIFQALIIVPLWMAMKKAGLSGALSLIAIIPTLGLIIALFILAFSRWKVVPAPEYAAGYPPQAPLPPGYPAVYPQGTTPATTNYTAPGAYAPAAPTYPPAASYPPAPTYPPPPADPRSQG